MNSLSSKRKWLRDLTLFMSSLFAHTFSFGFFDSFYIPGFLINRFLKKKPPIVKRWMILEFTFSNLFCDFFPENQELKLDADVSVQMMNDKMWFGKISLISSYIFDPQSNQIFLKNPRIASFDFEDIHEKASQLIEQISPSIGSLFNGYAVYELSDEDLKLLKKPPSSIVVEQGGIRFRFD